jgi:mycofactocin radical SAM maturase
MTSIPLTQMPKTPPLVEQLKGGLDAPICLTWELTYACNLSCVHCLSSSGRRDPNELSTEQAKAVIDTLAELQVFYVNIGGGEPMIRRDFNEIVDYAVSKNVGVKFSTNGTFIDAEAAERFANMPLLDIQISMDGVDAAVNDAVRGEGSWAASVAAMDHLFAAGMKDFKISVVVTRHNVDQLDDYKMLADSYGAQLRLTRLRPSGRGVDTYDELRLTQPQQRQLYDWLMDHPDTLTGDSFFHLSALGEQLPGLNLCGAGRIVCLIDPVGDVYACPFVIHERFKAGNVSDTGGFAEVWKHSQLFTELREPDNPGACGSCGSYDACQGGCMAAKFFTGMPLEGPDPDCVKGHGDTYREQNLLSVPKSDVDHSRPGASNGPTPISLGRKR